jgi:hypothetical protein
MNKWTYAKHLIVISIRQLAERYPILKWGFLPRPSVEMKVAFLFCVTSVK